MLVIPNSYICTDDLVTHVQLHSVQCVGA